MRPPPRRTTSREVAVRPVPRGYPISAASTSTAATPAAGRLWRALRSPSSSWPSPTPPAGRTDGTVDTPGCWHRRSKSQITRPVFPPLRFHDSLLVCLSFHCTGWLPFPTFPDLGVRGPAVTSGARSRPSSTYRSNDAAAAYENPVRCRKKPQIPRRVGLPTLLLLNGKLVGIDRVHRPRHTTTSIGSRRPLLSPIRDVPSIRRARSSVPCCNCSRNPMKNRFASGTAHAPRRAMLNTRCTSRVPAAVSTAKTSPRYHQCPCTPTVPGLRSTST